MNHHGSKSNLNFIYIASFSHKIPLKVFSKIKTGMTRNALKYKTQNDTNKLFFFKKK